MIKKWISGLSNLAAAAADGVDGLEGTAPKTVEPLEFVVFNSDELMLHVIRTKPILVR